VLFRFVVIEHPMRGRVDISHILTKGLCMFFRGVNAQVGLAVAGIKCRYTSTSCRLKGRRGKVNPTSIAARSSAPEFN
jgi:hypothetical protein